MIPKPTKRPKKAPKPLRRRETLGAKRHEAKAAGGVDPDTWQDVLRFYCFGCAYCNADHWDHMDHCKPLSRGGRHHISNVAPSCARCNYRKGTRTAYPPIRHPYMEAA